MLATRFIIALCPATPIYLVKYDVPANRIFSRHAATVSTETTRVKGEAALFDTFEAAMELCADITGWGGAQRVEQVAVEVEDTRVTLDTPEARIEVRDNATAQYNAAIDAGYAERNAAEEVAKELRSLGIKVGVDYRDGASCTVSLYLADHLGNLLDLDWDPMQDGFSYETEGDDACDIGETEAQYEAEPNTVCDGCGSTDAEPCGDSEGFAYCAACRAKDNDRSFHPHGVDADAKPKTDPARWNVAACEAAVTAYADTMYGEAHTAFDQQAVQAVLTDLMADLRKWATAEGVDFDAAAKGS